MLKFIARLKLLLPILVLCDWQASGAATSDYAQLVGLAEQWRQFAAPPISDCLPDYSPAALSAKALLLAKFRARLAAIDGSGWSVGEKVDRRLIEAEINGLDFDLRVLRPWARDPSFYATIWGEQSDVPAHEGPGAAPVIDLFKYTYPLATADQRELTCLIGAVPALLAAAKTNLKDGNARDLWLYGGRAFKQQSALLAALAAGTLDMRTLDGTRHATLEGADPALLQAVEKARQATDAFGAWVDAEAAGKTGPSGVGKEHYSWYQKYVHLVPYDWQAQVTLMERELERSHTALVLEEFRNRALPPLTPADSWSVFKILAAAKSKRIADFLIDSGIVADRNAYRDALAAQQLDGYALPGARNFFAETLAREPLGLYSHEYHWVELARLHYEPSGDEIRRTIPLSNIFDTRSEGLATAMEEILMQAGLYDDAPRGREIVLTMLANRAARGLASLYVQANQIDLAQAGQFHSRWTPRGWSDAASDLVGFEQLLYLRQPGYGTSYITGKLQFDRLIADAAQQAESRGEPFSLPGFFARFNQSGILPFALIEQEMLAPKPRLGEE
jgi:hypothetical protein